MDKSGTEPKRKNRAIINFVEKKYTMTYGPDNKVKEEKFNYLVKINNMKQVKYITLPKIVIPSEQIPCYLILHIDKIYESYNFNGQIVLEKTMRYPKTIHMTMSFVDKHDQKDNILHVYIEQDSTKRDSVGRQIKEIERLIQIDYIYDEQNNLLLNDNLIMNFDIRIGNNVLESTESNAFNEKMLKYRLREFNDFEQLTINDKYSDVKIITNGTEVMMAHKSILSARSKVFAMMFENDMHEKNSNTVEIIDIDEEVLKELLRFIYVAKVHNIESLAVDLIYAADKYELQGLKNLCEQFLMNNITYKNITEILGVIDRHDTKKLRKSAYQYLREKGANIIQTENFKSAVNLLSANMKTEINSFCNKMLKQ